MTEDDTFDSLKQRVVRNEEGTYYYDDNNECHRVNDLPAVIWPDGSKYWYQNDEIHRDGGPAIIWANGVEEWYQNGERHRDNGQPAIIWSTGAREWWVNDKLHRTSGPAVEYVDGTNQWWVNGVQQTKPKSFQEAANLSDEKMTLLLMKYSFK